MRVEINATEVGGQATGLSVTLQYPNAGRDQCNGIKVLGYADSLFLLQYPNAGRDQCNIQRDDRAELSQ